MAPSIGLKHRAVYVEFVGNKMTRGRFTSENFRLLFSITNQRISRPSYEADAGGFSKPRLDGTLSHLIAKIENSHR
jgi:hypothetical protein